MFTRFRRSLQPQDPLPLQISRYSTLSLDSNGTAVLDGQEFKAHIGCWMFYLPETQTKIFHAREGMIDCTHAPEIDNKEDLKQPVGNYIAADWFAALQTPINQRLAEIWLVSARLWRFGLGPQPLGICFIDQFSRDKIDLGPSCGLLCQNVHTLPRKRKCKLEQIVEAGVIPDHILSCVRQQLQGYVIDLCSVKGCRPAAAAAEVEKLERLFEKKMGDPELIKMLQQTLSW